MIQLEKAYKTKDGSEVVIYTITAGGKYPVHAGVVIDDAIKMQTYNMNGETPHSEQNGDLDIDLSGEEVIPNIGETCIFSDFDKLMPVIGIFQKHNKEGFWAMVDTGAEKLELKVFDAVQFDIPDLEEVMMTFIEDRNEVLDENKDAEDPEEENEEHSVEVRSFEDTMKALFGALDVKFVRM